MGNHENNANYEIVRQEMERTGIRLLEHQVDTLWKGNQYILLCGIRNPFDLTKNGISPTLSLQAEDYVIMLTHTPDYVEDVDVSNTDRLWLDILMVDRSVFSDDILQLISQNMDLAF